MKQMSLKLSPSLLSENIDTKDSNNDDENNFVSYTSKEVNDCFNKSLISLNKYKKIINNNDARNDTNNVNIKSGYIENNLSKKFDYSIYYKQHTFKDILPNREASLTINSICNMNNKKLKKNNTSREFFNQYMKKSNITCEFEYIECDNKEIKNNKKSTYTGDNRDKTLSENINNMMYKFNALKDKYGRKKENNSNSNMNMNFSNDSQYNSLKIIAEQQDGHLSLMNNKDQDKIRIKNISSNKESNNNYYIGNLIKENNQCKYTNKSFINAEVLTESNEDCLKKIKNINLNPNINKYKKTAYNTYNTYNTYYTNNNTKKNLIKSSSMEEMNMINDSLNYKASEPLNKLDNSKYRNNKQSHHTQLKQTRINNSNTNYKSPSITKQDQLRRDKYRIEKNIWSFIKEKIQDENRNILKSIGNSSRASINTSHVNSVNNTCNSILYNNDNNDNKIYAYSNRNNPSSANNKFKNKTIHYTIDDDYDNNNIVIRSSNNNNNDCNKSSHQYITKKDIRDFDFYCTNTNKDKNAKKIINLMHRKNNFSKENSTSHVKFINTNSSDKMLNTSNKCYIPLSEKSQFPVCLNPELNALSKSKQIRYKKFLNDKNYNSPIAQVKVLKRNDNEETYQSKISIIDADNANANINKAEKIINSINTLHDWGLLQKEKQRYLKEKQTNNELRECSFIPDLSNTKHINNDLFKTKNTKCNKRYVSKKLNSLESNIGNNQTPLNNYSYYRDMFKNN